MSLIYSGDIGAVIRVNAHNTSIDPSTALSLIVRKPDGTLVTWVPTVNFTSGILTYTSIAGDLVAGARDEIAVSSHDRRSRGAGALHDEEAVRIVIDQNPLKHR